MKNITNEKPSKELHGRKLFSTKFVSDKDITGKTILDIGCGYGWFELNALTRNADKIYGLEYSEKDLETAKINIISEKVEFCTYAESTDEAVTKLPFEDGTFDTIVCWEVLEHIPKNTEAQMFREAYRVLKDGGVFYLSTPHKHIISNMFDPAWFLIGHRHYSTDSLLKFGKDSRFSIEELKIRGGAEALYINTLYVSKWILRRPLIFSDYLNRKVDNEYLRKENGFMNVFVKYRK